MTNLKQIGEMLDASERNLAVAIRAYRELVGQADRTYKPRNSSNSVNKLHAGVKFVSEDQGKEAREALKELLKTRSLRKMGEETGYSDATIYAIKNNPEKRMKVDLYEAIMKLKNN